MGDSLQKVKGMLQLAEARFLQSQRGIMLVGQFSNNAIFAHDVPSTSQNPPRLTSLKFKLLSWHLRCLPFECPPRSSWRPLLLHTQYQTKCRQQRPKRLRSILPRPRHGRSLQPRQVLPIAPSKTLCFLAAIKNSTLQLLEAWVKLRALVFRSILGRVWDQLH